MFKKIFHYFKSRPGLFILFLLLSFITFSNLKPDFYLLGWDNYSSYFNLKTNIFRTFFATWRAYRGLGVPSDSESTDLFRQLFYLLLSPVVKQQLLDQLYILFALNAGVLFMYFFSGSLFSPSSIKKTTQTDIIGFISSLFYLFNLNTLSTFYFPMIMFVNRFYTVPLILLLLLRLIRKGKGASRADYLIFIFATILTSGTYMTATVFITFVVVIFLFLLFQGRSIQSSLLLFVLFISLNSFWLLPFANYTVSRSGLVYSAPTFIEANEIQLNKPASFYSWDKQLILYPNFFDTPISNIQKTFVLGYHPLITQLNNPATKFFIFLFPTLFIIGGLAIFFKPKKNKNIMWIPITLFLYIFLSFKEFSPLGFLYIFFEHNLPFFANLFRFGDTKFHFFIAFSGSLAVGYLFSIVSYKISQKTLSIIAAILLISGLFTFKDYVSGRVFGFFMRNKIPDAYFKIADVINADKGQGRVLHLPYDQNGYWRSYSWGYLGSSFLHFMIDHPLLEKTFEPTSGENARLNNAVFQNIENSQATDNLFTYQEKTTNFYQLLKKTGVKYLILDGTVTAEQAVKGISLWGRFNEVDSQSMITHLEQMGLIKWVGSYPVAVADYLNAYEKIFSIPSSLTAAINEQPAQLITLYEVLDIDPPVRISSSAALVDSHTQSINIDPRVDTFQKPGTMGKILPFQRPDVPFIFKNGKGSISFPDTVLQKNKSYTVILPQVLPHEKEQTLLVFYGAIDNKNLIITIYQKPTPDISINGKSDQNLVEIKKILVPLSRVSTALSTSQPLKNYVSNWQQLPYSEISSLRIQIGDTVIPVPLISKNTNTYIGSLVSPIDEISLSILVPQQPLALTSSSFAVTDIPNCFGDKLSGYSFSQSVNDSGARSISSVNGSTCFLTHIASLNPEIKTYSELSFSYEASQKNLDNYQAIQTSKPQVLDSLSELSKPNMLSVCLKDAATPACFNTHQIVNLQEKGSFVFPTEKGISAFDPVAFFALKNTGQQSQSAILSNISFITYKSIQEEKITPPSSAGKTFSITAPENAPFSLQIDQSMNSSSFYQVKQDGMYLSNGLCTKPGSYRTFRQMDSSLLSYFVGCDSNFSVPLEFDSNSLFVWGVEYHLASGKYPRFTLSDGFITYASEYLSLNQGYPSIPGFFSLQNPENYFSQYTSLAQLQSASLSAASVVISSHSAYRDSSQKNYQIAQDSENEGIALYGNMNVATLPNLWGRLSIEPSENMQRQNMEVSDVISKNILPSLWKVQFTPAGKGMVVFNEAYDAQWRAYANWGDVLLGKQIAATHYKCNGFANCFDLLENTSSFYIVYWPEKLNLLGWIITLLLGAFTLLLVKKPLKVDK